MLTAVDVQQISCSRIRYKGSADAAAASGNGAKISCLHLNEARKLEQEKVHNAEEAERVQLRDKEERRQRKKMAPERPRGEQNRAKRRGSRLRKNRENTLTFGMTG